MKLVPVGGSLMPAPFSLKTAQIDRDGANPSSAVYASDSIFYFVDKDGERIGMIRPAEAADGRMGLQLCAIRENDSSAEVSNAMYLWVAKDGTKTYHIDSPENFRSAISAAAASHTHTIDKITWPQDQNLVCTTNKNDAEWSVDMPSGSYTGCYWHVWSGKNSAPVIKCYNDNCNVEITNGRLQVRSKSMSYIAGLTNPAIYQAHPSSDTWSPILAWRTKSQGGWSLGSYVSDNLQFAFGTAANISADNNSCTIVEVRPSGGTLALVGERQPPRAWTYLAYVYGSAWTSYNKGSYVEFLVYIRHGTNYNASAVIKSDHIDGTTREFYVGGGYGGTGYLGRDAVVKINNSQFQLSYVAIDAGTGLQGETECWIYGR